MAGNNGGTPIRCVFIGGCERSGTTMLGSMLGSAQGAICTPESQFKRDVLVDASRGVYSSRTVIRKLTSHLKYLMWELHLDEAALSAAADEGPDVLLLELVRWFAASQGIHEPWWWIDHTPSNMREASLLSGFFPTCHFVHIVRDGRAVAASLMPLHWGPTQIEEAAQYWVYQTALGLAREQAASHPAIRIRYEDLVASPEENLLILCRKLELPFLPRMAEGKGFSGKPRQMAETHALVGNRPDVHRIDAWQDVLSPREIEIFEWYAGPLLELLGYELLFASRARPPSRNEHRMLTATGLANRMLKALRARKLALSTRASSFLDEQHQRRHRSP